MNKIDFTIIIPQRNSLDSLPRLLNSIPANPSIQVVIVDNSENPIKKNDVKSERLFELYYSTPNRFAGGARNVALEHAKGEWIIFSDADDFFTEKAFDVFYSHLNDDKDLIYFKSESVYDDTLEPSDRHLLFNSYIDKFISGEYTELDCKLAYLVPWGKMVRKSLIDEHNIRFDEVLAANDINFSTKVGFYSQKFAIDENAVYVITTRKASLANRLDLPVIQSRFRSTIRRNIFLKEVGLSYKRGSVMVYLYQSYKFGVFVLLSFVWEAIKNRQNLFLGMSNWLSTYRVMKRNQSINKKYISK